MISSIVDGKVLDWNWKRREVDTVFYIGDMFAGQLFNLGKSGWTAVPLTGRKVSGFKTRYSASAYLEELLLK